MKVGSDVNLGLRREYPKKLFGPIFFSCQGLTLRFQAGTRKGILIKNSGLKQDFWLL